MTWGNSSNISTTNLDSGTDSPAAARADIKAALDEVSNLCDGRAAANGVAPLDGSSKIAATYLPDEINSSASTDLTLDPSTNIVAIEDIVKLTPKTTAQLNAQSNLANGMIAFCSDAQADSAGATGVPVYYADSMWRSMLTGEPI